MKILVAGFVYLAALVSSAVAQPAPPLTVCSGTITPGSTLTFSITDPRAGCLTGVLTAPTQSSVSAPTAPASTSTYAMQGLAGKITPVRTGNVLITISGTVLASTVTAGDRIAYQISYGTGTAPSNAGSLTGTQVGVVQENTNPSIVIAADVHVPFSVTASVTGLTVGTTYWIDLAAKSVGTVSSDSLSNVSVSAVEN